MFARPGQVRERSEVFRGLAADFNAVQVETTSSQLGGVMTDTSIRELPLNQRNAYALLQLQPGVQSQLGADLFAGSENPGVVSVNGGRGRANNYMVNGGDGNDIFVNAPAIQPSPDAIEEFRVLTNTFDAEYGRNSGSVVNVVTKSGTNSVHGDFYDFLRNDALNSRGYFDNTIAPYKQNQFGATLGGPIKKDRTFIFGSYEGNRLHQGVSTGQVQLPTAAEAAGDFSEPGLEPGGGPAQVFTGGIADQTFADVLNARPGCSAAVLTQSGQAIAVGSTYGTTSSGPGIFTNVATNTGTKFPRPASILPPPLFTTNTSRHWGRHLFRCSAGDRQQQSVHRALRPKITGNQQESGQYRAGGRAEATILIESLPLRSVLPRR